MDNLGRLSGYITKCPGDLSLFRSKGPHDASWYIFLLSCFPIFLGLFPLPLRTNYLHPGLCLLKFGFWGTQTRTLPSATVVFEAFHHLTVLASGCRLPRLAEYLGSCAEMNSVYPQLHLWLISFCPVVILVHSSPPISGRLVPLFHRWHLTGSLLITGSGTFVQKNASLVFKISSDFTWDGT